MDNHLKHFIAILVLGVVFVMGIFAWDARYDGMTSAAARVSRLSPAAGMEENRLGDSWNLVDQNGKPVTQGSYEDKFKLVFFGFASCPDICPTTLQKISKTMEMLGKQSGGIKPLFITTDPANDTPEVLGQYLSQFGPQFTGLTGSQEQIDGAVESFHAYAEKIDDGKGGYFMNHSSVVYFMSPSNELLSVFDSTDSPADMAKEIRPLLPQG